MIIIIALIALFLILHVGGMNNDKIDENSDDPYYNSRSERNYSEEDDDFFGEQSERYDDEEDEDKDYMNFPEFYDEYLTGADPLILYEFSAKKIIYLCMRHIESTNIIVIMKPGRSYEAIEENKNIIFVKSPSDIKYDNFKNIINVSFNADFPPTFKNKGKYFKICQKKSVQYYMEESEPEKIHFIMFSLKNKIVPISKVSDDFEYFLKDNDVEYYNICFLCAGNGEIEKKFAERQRYIKEVIFVDRIYDNPQERPAINEQDYYTVSYFTKIQDIVLPTNGYPTFFFAFNPALDNFSVEDRENNRLANEYLANKYVFQFGHATCEQHVGEECVREIRFWRNDTKNWKIY